VTRTGASGGQWSGGVTDTNIRWETDMNQREQAQGKDRRDGGWRVWVLAVVVGGTVLVTGCSTRSAARVAPVEDRGTPRASDLHNVTGAPAPVRQGYYTVKRGDTLYRIALDAGQAPRDLQAWNGLTNPDLIEVGQVLRIAPPTSTAVATASGAPATGPAVVARPLPPATTGGAPPTAAPVAPAPGAAAPGAAVPVTTEHTPAGPAAGGGPEELPMVWPAQGELIAAFDEARNKGVSIGGRIGDPVVAAADGSVVYAGAGLRGYGNLIILKHNSNYLTAYAHNQALLVRENQTVRQGQRIAEMGSSDADRVKLHFEVRRKGKPVDPVAYLPKR
jgi:lipoprotein NlpD